MKCRAVREEKISAELKDAIELLDDFVAFADGGFELLAAQDFEGATAVLDNFFSLEGIGGEANAGTVGAEHGGEEIMRDGQGTGVDAIGGHEEPAGEAFAGVVETITGSGLGDLHTLNDGVAA